MIQAEPITAPLKKKWMDPKDKLASICAWELYLEFRNPEQIKGIVGDLMQQELMFEIETGANMTETTMIYSLRIKCSWANNLTHVAELVKKWDYYEELHDEV